MIDDPAATDARPPIAPVAGRDDLGALSILDTAAALGVGRSTVYALIRDGELRPIKVRSRTLVPVAQVRAILRNGAR